MRSRASAAVIAVIVLLAAVAVTGAAAAYSRRFSAPDCGDHWVDAWMAAMQDTTVSVAPATPSGSSDLHTFADQTFRMVVTPQTDGTSIRVAFSNRFGTAPLSLTDVHVGIAPGAPAVVSGTDRQLRFDGSTEATIPPGAVVQSDAVDLAVEAFTPLAVTYYVPDPSSLDIHLEAMQTQYATPGGSGDHAAETSGTAFTEQLSSWLAVSSVQVRASSLVQSAVAIGDSLTDGVGSTDNANARWTDDLNRRLQTTSQRLVVVNAGISGNQAATDNVVGETDVVHGAGPSTANRIENDALDQPGVAAVVVYSGINDLLAATSDDPATAVIDSYKAMIDRAHGAGARVIGVTLTPAGRTGDIEDERQAVNEWIRSSGAFDAVFDFDAAVRNPFNTSLVRPDLTTDALHLNDTGYQLLADTVDVSEFPSTFGATTCSPQ